MATIDFAPMFRSTIGFDDIPDLLSRAIERGDSGYPPYNIEKLGPDEFRIVMAVAGLGRDDIEIVQAENRVTIKGSAKTEGARTYLYRGLSTRPFTREFDLADYVEVVGATLENGLLIISLKRELPEAMKPRSIAINIGDGAHAGLGGSDKKAA